MDIITCMRGGVFLWATLGERKGGRLLKGSVNDQGDKKASALRSHLLSTISALRSTRRWRGGNEW